jgi:hypothetical protein
MHVVTALQVSIFLLRMGEHYSDHGYLTTARYGSEVTMRAGIPPSRARIWWNAVTAGSSGTTIDTPMANLRQCAKRSWSCRTCRP